MGRLILWHQILCIFLSFFHFQATCSISPKLPKSCLPKERFALLQFKSQFSQAPKFGNPKTNTWKEDTNCCSWDGVTCDRLTGHVINLDLSNSWLHGSIPSNSSLFLLSHLQSLNLAHNNFSYSSIPSGFGLLTKLTQLNLSHSNFSGQIPPEMSHLSKMVLLDLTTPTNGYLEFETGRFEKLSQNLTELSVLHLTGVNMSSVALKSLLNLSTSLTSLHLGDCSLRGKFPEDLLRFPSLEVIDLSSNKDVTGNFPMSNWGSPLRSLVVSQTNFSGEIPDSIGNLKSLEFLDLSSNNFTGPLPFSVFNLSRLSVLDFSINQLVGHLPYSISGLPNLYHLALSHNLLTGRIPSGLFTLPSLQQLDLRNNLLTGPIEQFQQNNSLEIVYLENNVIKGPIPDSIFELESLTELYLSLNNLSGIIEWNMLQKLKQLEVLDLSHNAELSLINSTSIVNFTMPNLEILYLSSCNINEFPYFLRTLENLGSLDLSNNRIHGWISTNQELKGWPSLYYLDLSDNFLTGLEQHPWKNVQILNLRFNLLQGPLSVPPASTTIFLISNNKLTGVIPTLLCNVSGLFILDLSDNYLSGVIPQCLGNFSNSLSTLNLRNNYFNGGIIETFAKGGDLNYLDLSGNKFKGPLPRSLVNCTNLEVLNLDSNKINDTFPYWLETLPELKILVFRSNNFHGTIGNPRTVSPFPKLRILDVSHNEFTGLLPIKYLQHLKILINMSGVHDEPKYVAEAFYYPESLVVGMTLKGFEIDLGNIQNIDTNVDFSNNQFEGEIPATIGMLKSLRLLNFSHNSLTGRIPTSLGSMSALESLDLSSNKLVGEIPWQLTNLTFLAVLNLSNNQLTGLIPQANQFSTFSNDSYRGNSGLCGLPLSKKCNNIPPPRLPSARSNEGEEDSVVWFDWKIAAMGYGSGMVIGLSMGYIVFTTGKPYWLVRMVERKQHKKVRRSNPRRRGRRN